MNNDIQDTITIGDNFYTKGDFKNAFDCYRNAALDGSGEAAFKLGEMYEYGIFVKQDDKIARQWYFIAARKDYALAVPKIKNGLHKESKPQTLPSIEQQSNKEEEKRKQKEEEERKRKEEEERKQKEEEERKQKEEEERKQKEEEERKRKEEEERKQKEKEKRKLYEEEQRKRYEEEKQKRKENAHNKTAAVITAIVTCFIVTFGIVYFAVIKCSDNKSKIHYRYVDLGLPSGTLWATCNVGANNPWDYGDYFAWGETNTKSQYDWSTYKYANGDPRSLTKYCNQSSCGNNGYTDRRNVIEKDDDIAYQIWGSDWCMPSPKQFQELCDHCISEWDDNYQGKGINGRVFKSKKNGNTIFFPAAGWKSEKGGVILDIGDNGQGNYWASSYTHDYPFYGCILRFDYDDVYSKSYHARDVGLPVRPVRCKN